MQLFFVLAQSWWAQAFVLELKSWLSLGLILPLDWNTDHQCSWVSGSQTSDCGASQSPWFQASVPSNKSLSLLVQSYWLLFSGASWLKTPEKWVWLGPYLSDFFITLRAVCDSYSKPFSSVQISPGLQALTSKIHLSLDESLFRHLEVSQFSQRRWHHLLTLLPLVLTLVNSSPFFAVTHLGTSHLTLPNLVP